MKYYNCKEISEMTKISIRRLQQMCKNGEMTNCKKENGIWYIPKYFLDNYYETNDIRPVPVGVTDYEKICMNNYVVDKTLLIKDIIDNGAMTTLFLRPSSFGKTLNMSMLKTFFEISDEDKSIYFKDKLIWKCGPKYIKHLGSYPVIYLTFKDITADTFQTLKELMIGQIIEEYKRHYSKLDLKLFNKYDIDYIERIIFKTASDGEYLSSLYQLSKILSTNYNQPCVVIIDEYDTPIQSGYFNDYYKQMISFIRTLFSYLLKDNNYIAYGFLTGILRIAKESIFNGLNNLYVNTILDENYSNYFGFTNEEIIKLLEYYNASDCYDDIKKWYDGYKFGNTEIYNPWSIICCITNKFKYRPYWLSTPSNDIIKEVKKNDEITNNLHLLLNGDSIEVIIRDNIIYPELNDDKNSIYSFLLMSGYLRCDYDEKNDEYYVRIPNLEINNVFKGELLN